MRAAQKKIIKIFFDHAGVDAVLVFGSQVSERTTVDSDIDLAVLYNNRKIPSVEKVLALKEDLSGKLKKRVDLVLLNRSNPILTHQIFKLNMVIFNKNPAHLDEIFVKHVTAYADLKRSRKVIEDNILKRKLYG